MKYLLGNKVYITKEYNEITPHKQKIKLFINGELIKESFTTGGYKLKDLKRIGEKWCKENPYKNKTRRNVEVW